MDFNRFTPKLNINKPSNSKNGVMKSSQDKTVVLQGELRVLSIKDVKFNPNQARTFVDNDSFKRLKNSIKREGVLSPLIAYQDTEGSYILLAGERRTRACIDLGYSKATYLIQKKPSQKVFTAISTNEFPEAIHPINKGVEVQSLMDIYKAKGEKPPIRAIAEYYGVKESTIYEWRRYSDIDRDIRENIVRLDIRSKDFLRKVTRICKSVDNEEISAKEKTEKTNTLVNELIDHQKEKQSFDKSKVLVILKRSLGQISEASDTLTEKEKAELKKMIRSFSREL